ncbi:3-hydroxyisobutyrate dehydrogenase [Burkholderiales bacterium 8X]|nr:3-hydroxyisobutyrate dehydrogenase [Burkholderiales bacterium 8X]
MTTARVPIGFIGLGSMGGPMATRLAQAGWPISVFDTDADAIDRVESQGARRAASAREVGDRAEIVFCCLPAPAISEQVAGELRGSAACAVLVEMSTVGRDALRRIAQAAGERIELLDCPISGGRPRALEGKLTAIVAGPAALVERVRPCLGIVASQLFVVGPEAGQAQVCKIANNAISITGMVVACEAVVMGVKAGLDPAVMIDVINASTGRNSATVDKFPRAILPRSFDYGGPISIGSKDLGLYIEEARAQQVSALAVSNAAQLWSLAADRFGDKADMTMFIRLLEQWAGLGEDGRPARPAE